VSSPAAQGIPQIDTRIRVIDAKTEEPIAASFLLRDGDGQIVNTASNGDAELVFLVNGRKLSIEPAAKGAKQAGYSLTLEDAPQVYVILCVDSFTGRITEVRQKPVLPAITRGPGKVRKSGGGQFGLSGGPAFDDCATAPTVGCNSSTAFNNAGGTTDGTDPVFTCRIGGAAQGFGTSWFRFVATGTSATIDTNGSLTSDTLLAVYSGTCGALTQIACDDDAGTGLLSLVNVMGLTIGQTYYIQVAGWGAGNVGDNVLNVTCAGGPPAFDECVGAPMVDCGSSTAFNNSAATVNPMDPLFACRVGGPAQGFGTSWFRFTATSTTAVIDTNGSSTSDTLLAVYSGTCGSLTQIGCDDDAGTGLLSLVSLMGLTPGQTYYIEVAGWGAGNVGDNVLNVTCGAPAGDDCDEALPIACGGSETVNNVAFTTDPADPAYSCRFSGPGQGFGTAWFKFVATDTSAQIDTLGSTAFDTLLAVYDGTCGSFTELACNDDSIGLLSSLCVEGLVPGNTYYIQASSFSAFDLGDITVNVECPCPLPPANDECENAEALAVPGSVTFDNSLATDDIVVPCGVFSGPFKNVWYLVAGTGNTMTATTCNAGTVVTDTKISVFCADCGELVCVGGNDDDCPAGGPIFSSTVNWCSQLGANYLITVGNFSGATAPGQIQLDVFDDGASCVPDVVCLPQGACCLADGSCVVATSDDCVAMGGTYQGDGTACDANAVDDGSFEAGLFAGTWNESSTNFGTPLCDAACTANPDFGPRTGSFWAWFGGILAFEEGSLSQTVTIPVGATSLDFYLEINFSSLNGTDFLEVLVDGNQEYLVLESAGPYMGYVLQQVDISGYADGGMHTIEFHSIISGSDITNFFVDDVAINTTSTICPQPLGACCLMDGSCVEVTEEDCAMLGGMFNGDFSLCVDADCPQPIDCFVLDFETDDSGAAIGHGDRINTEFDGGANFPVTITGSEAVSGDNTAAALNSTTGPASQDPDLLVGCGNILILQNDGSQSLCGPDTYCTHNDDDDGGSLSFVFNVPTTPSSVVLIDIDSTDGMTSVVLTDVGGATRTYSVPAGWTGDLVADATSGKGTLDLTTLANQMGFGSTATATEDPGFDGTQVISIVVTLGGSGGVDDLSWCQPNM
jgi:hypothetical protein